MIVPIGHENMSARRWPIITLALILVNLLIFASTHRTVDQQDSQLWKVNERILILAATHPNLILAPKAREFVDGVRSQFPDDWAQLQDPKSEITDEWASRIRQIDDSTALQAEMDSLGAQYSRLTASSITERYAFVPANSKPITYLTSTFLHANWWPCARQYVVLVAGRICTGGCLGPTGFTSSSTSQRAQWHASSTFGQAPEALCIQWERREP